MTAKRPRLPAPLALPLKLIPGPVHGLVLPQILNRALATEITDGELDFLAGHCVCIRVSDAGLAFRLTLRDGRIAVADARQPADLTITGTLYDYLLLITGREDPDTLFFQRHLAMQGDTHLGVHLKNMLAAVDMESLPLSGSLQPMLQRALNLYERIA